MSGSIQITNEGPGGFNYGNVRFSIHLPQMPAITTTEDIVVILKSPQFLKKYDAILSTLPTRNVVEVGIAEGGSLIYFALAFPHLRFVGIDLRTPNQHVLNHIDRLGLRDRISINYGIDQADTAKIHSAITKSFGEEPLGAVIDDASHFYAPSKGTFESTFGWLAANGYYCFEDWSWAHEPGPCQSTTWIDKTAPSNLLFEIIMAQPSQPALIEDILVDRNVAFIKRGSTQKVHKLELDQMVLNRGKKMVLI